MTNRPHDAAAGEGQVGEGPGGRSLHGGVVEPGEASLQVRGQLLDGRVAGREGGDEGRPDSRWEISLTEKRASASVISESRGGAAHPPVIGRIAGDVPRDGACRPESQ